VLWKPSPDILVQFLSRKSPYDLHAISIAIQHLFMN